MRHDDRLGPEAALAESIMGNGQLPWWRGRFRSRVMYFEDIAS